MAQLIDNSTDLIIVGDSVGMIEYGMASTLGVTLDMMIAHGKAVMRGVKRACVVIDMPFSSYQESPQIAYRNAAKIMAETGAMGVKLEGGTEFEKTVSFLAKRGIPVMSHIGLMPQYHNSLGGFGAQGLDAESAQQIMEDGKTLSDAGAFSLLIEGTDESTARTLTQNVPIPTIGIGASPACDGQVLVTEDLLGLFSDYTPKFVKQYVNLGEQIQKAVEAYADDVQTGEFPQMEHCFGTKKNAT
jgi:3-methyl-2-oxobutanoate hydroxymethyltransferase